jgi:hypothetical protein
MNFFLSLNSVPVGRRDMMMSFFFQTNEFDTSYCERQKNQQLTLSREKKRGNILR